MKRKRVDNFAAAAAAAAPPLVRERKYFLLKNEPEEFSIDMLKDRGESIWDGIRSFAARKHLRSMHKGDLCFFYHSSTKIIGIAGVFRILDVSFPCPLQFDEKSKYFDPKASKESPIWDAVKVSFVTKFENIITLKSLQEDLALSPNGPLKDLFALKRGNRLSVQTVSPPEFEYILRKFAKSHCDAILS